MTQSSSSPEFSAVILAATRGDGLYPLTSVETPKHLLPIAGVPMILRLLKSVKASGFTSIIVALANGDDATLALLQNAENVTVHILSDDCDGSAQALVELDDKVPPKSHVVVLPGDLLVLDTSVLTGLVDTHRKSNLPPTKVTTPCTMLLAHVGEQDEHGIPLKESAKQKKGGLAREPDDIEYIALLDSRNDSLAPRVVWKQLQQRVEHDDDMVGETPKFIIPKARLRGGELTVTKDWTDVHTYVLSPWLRSCLKDKSNMVSLQENGVPLWVARQFHGSDMATDEYAVRAHGLEGWKALRVGTYAAYLYACRQVVSLALEDTDDKKNVLLPEGTTVSAKFHSIILPEASLKAKVKCQSSTVGRKTKVSDKCRLNNVVLMDNVTVHDNCLLQNTIIGEGCIIHENCSLNDCQVAPGTEIAAGTKEKGESAF